MELSLKIAWPRRTIIIASIGPQLSECKTKELNGQIILSFIYLFIFSVRSNFIYIYIYINFFFHNYNRKSENLNSRFLGVENIMRSQSFKWQG